MLQLIQVTTRNWTVTDSQGRDMSAFEADSELDAMSYAANMYPGRPVELDVDSYSNSVENLLSDLGFAA